MQIAGFRLILTMPSRHRLRDYQREEPLLCWMKELASRKLTDDLRSVSSVIQRLYQRFLETGTVQERRHCGRPMVTSRQEDHYLVISSLRERSATSVTLRGQLREASGANISCSTVRRRLAEQNLRSRRSAVRPVLSDVNRARRRAWAQAHVT